MKSQSLQEKVVVPTVERKMLIGVVRNVRLIFIVTTNVSDHIGSQFINEIVAYRRESKKLKLTDITSGLYHQGPRRAIWDMPEDSSQPKDVRRVCMKVERHHNDELMLTGLPRVLVWDAVRMLPQHILNPE